MGGLSINEAMCFELPVVCSVCDGTEKHLVRDGWNGLFFREGDASDLTEKIRVLLASREMRERMGRNSLRIIRDEMNIHTVIRCYLQCFNALTGRSLHEAPAARPCALRA
jgi:glycosyltransferase involved in cell wall biosynthesis